MGERITGVVTSDRHRSSPLVIGGLEIPIDVKVKWSDEKALDILKGKVHSVGFSMDEAYKDASEDILKIILGEDKNEFSSDDNDDVDAEIREHNSTNVANKRDH